MPYTITVPAQALPSVMHKFDLFARHCAKLGMAEPTLLEGTHSFVPDYTQAGLNPNPALLPQIEMVELTLHAPAVIALGGWQLLGRVDRLPDGAPLIARTPGTEAITLPVIDDAGACQHCGKSRVRTETFLVANLDGRLAQVGRNCLLDFLGHDPAAALRQAKLLDDFTKSFGHGFGPTSEFFYDTAAVLALAAQVAAHGGFLGTHKAAEINAEIEAQGLLRQRAVSTLAHVLERLLRPRAMGSKERIARDQFEHEWDQRFPDDATTVKLAADMAEGIAQASVNPHSEWEANVAAVVAQPRLRQRHFGVAVSAALLGLRRQDRPAKSAQLLSRHLGVIGAKLTLPAEIVFVREFDGDFGLRTLFKFAAAEGMLTWWASGIRTKPAVEGLDGTMAEPGIWAVGDLLTLTGTVKGHDIDRWSGQPTTLLSRVKLVPRMMVPNAVEAPSGEAITAILDAIPGAFENVQAGLADIKAGNFLALKDL